MAEHSAKKYPASSPEVDALVREVIARIADRWTMEILDILDEHGTQRFSRIADQCSGISQKMLTQTLRQMERDGLVERTVHPVIPPHVDYTLTPLGGELSAAFCGVWIWAEKNAREVAKARASFDAKLAQSHAISTRPYKRDQPAGTARSVSERTKRSRMS